MKKIKVEKSLPLRGEVTISGSKNAVLPILAATLLTEKESTIYNVPYLNDVVNMSKLLAHYGANVSFKDKKYITITPQLLTSTASYSLVNKLRASFLTLGPILARNKHAKIYFPGGCQIGARPVDLHIKGFKALGAEVNINDGYIEAKADSLKGANIYLDFPSVGATQNIMMTATLAKGKTVIENAAQEPEIVDLAYFLNKMGAEIHNAGTNTITIIGKEKLNGCTHTVIPDRIEAASYMIASAITKGDILIKNVIPSQLKPIISKLKEANQQVITNTNSIRVIGNKNISSINITTLPHPGFPTDTQSLFMTLLTIANGTSTISENIFENRFLHVRELLKMGADIKTDGKVAIIKGVQGLSGAEVSATDLRAGMSLILAGLISNGQTLISDIYHIDRGYEDYIEKLSSLGAKVSIYNS